MSFRVAILGDGSAVFSDAPRVNNSTGDLAFALAGEEHGSVVLSVVLADDGGT